MNIASIRVQNLRNHTDFRCEFSSKSTLIYGKNGVGKTTILEAICQIYTGASFRGSDREMLQAGSSWLRIDAVDNKGDTRTFIFDNQLGSGRRQYRINSKQTSRLPKTHKKPIIVFSPDDLRMIDGSPARRRRYLDKTISQYDSQYTKYLHRYDKALLQRNRLLKQPNVDQDTIFSWNVILSETGAYIINARIHLVEIINQQITNQYRIIANKSYASIKTNYTHKQTSPNKLLQEYEQGLSVDIMRHTTVIGPHRHDLEIFINSKVAHEAASRGEIRTIILSLKYIEARLVQEYYNEHPIILLDDVFGELDKDRQNHLLTTFADNQIIITSTEKNKANSLVFIE